MPNVIKTLTYRCTLACAVVLASLNCRVHAQGGSGSMAARLLEASGGASFVLCAGISRGGPGRQVDRCLGGLTTGSPGRVPG